MSWDLIYQCQMTNAFVFKINPRSNAEWSDVFNGRCVKKMLRIDSYMYQLAPTKNSFGKTWRSLKAKNNPEMWAKVSHIIPDERNMEHFDHTSGSSVDLARMQSAERFTYAIHKYFWTVLVPRLYDEYWYIKRSFKNTLHNCWY